MNYQTFSPSSDLQSVVKCYWSLDVPADRNAPRQRILPDGCVDLIFILGDDVKRFTSGDDYILQPRAMLLGQITGPFFVQPTGYVHSFAARFYPFGFANFVSTPINHLANKETPIEQLFGKSAAKQLTENIVKAPDTSARIGIIEAFLVKMLGANATIDNIVRTTIDTMLQTKGSTPIKSILKTDPSKRRQLERKFLKQVGISPKQLGKVIRLQAVLKMMLSEQSEPLTRIAYESEYYDQAHFIKDFKEFTGTKPKDFLADEEMALSALLYKEG